MTHSADCMKSAIHPAPRIGAALAFTSSHNQPAPPAAG
ncbi:hypothetical protein PLANPX_4532 [Lacipirellula parvula]|uniref:Uncharacterized protein n=1 Tax=Lacipirellula parvula TaxID=2650471 RepID=A0A5K7XDS0_9BACT|nr:hypothetical protein PLANPX_4532 [Lacipirellula parvula]